MPNQHSDPLPWHDKNTLNQLYHEEKLSQSEIADRLGCTQPTINRWMRKLDVDKRDLAEAQGLRELEERPWHDPEKLRQLYYTEKMSLVEVADELGTSQQIILSWMDRFGIDRRPAYVTRVLRDPGAGFVHSDARGYEMIKHSVDDLTRNFPVHRLCAMAWFGIESVKDSVVHHRNGVKWDNREENLQLFEDQSEHMIHHQRERDRDGRYA